MSDIYVGNNARRLTYDSMLPRYTGVIINTSDETYVSAGDIDSSNAHVMEVSCDWATVADAQRILNSLSTLDYRPYEASGAIFNPAAELGDGISIGSIRSGLYAQDISFSRLMLSEISAPSEKAIDNEYKYEPKQDRVYKRQLANVRASIQIQGDRITSEVVRATQAEGSLSDAVDNETSRATQAEQSIITQTSSAISAKVSKTGGTASSFGWTLDDSSWSLTSGNTQVFKADSDGVSITGNITATSGNIGGAVIENGVLKVPAASIDTIHAKQIISDGANDRMSGSYIVSGSIGTGSGSALSSAVLSGVGGGINFSAMETQTYTAEWVACNHFISYGGVSSQGVNTIELHATSFWLNGDDSGHRVTWQRDTVVTGVSVSMNYDSPAEFYVEDVNGFRRLIHNYSGATANVSTVSLVYLGN